MGGWTVRLLIATVLLISILPVASAQTGIGALDATPTPSDPVKPILLKTIPIKDMTAVTTAPFQPGASLPVDAPPPKIVTTKPDLSPQIVNPLQPSSINPAKNP
jgi:hypothetical protein